MKRDSPVVPLVPVTPNRLCICVTNARWATLPLFASLAPPEAEAPREASAAEKLLGEVDPDTLTPKEALELVYKLRGTLKG